MGQVIHVALKVTAYLRDLVDILYEKGYFSYKENAQDYVNAIIDAIFKDLPRLTHHKASAAFIRYGRYYIKIKSSKRTVWYVFFDKKDNRFFVEFITNNHSPDAAHFNGL